MISIRRSVSCLLTTLLMGASLHASANNLQISSQSFADGAVIPKALIGSGAECGKGESLSPQVSWTNVPEGTRSLAIFLFDPDGAKGLGVSHWVAYNVDPARGQIQQGEARTSIEGVTIGQNSAGDPAYRGLCPPKGDHPHHYILTVVATDLEPGRLPEQMTREALFKAMKEHVLGAQSVVGLYGH